MEGIVTKIIDLVDLGKNEEAIWLFNTYQDKIPQEAIHPIKSFFETLEVRKWFKNLKEQEMIRKERQRKEFDKAIKTMFKKEG